jgi:2-polyprenyl-6-hydroxyphenyl methylase / 3-demethylubiquinone-9 3-methyltransferase
MASDAPALASLVPSSVIPREAAHFGAQAQDWWNPRGSSAMLHKLGPARLGYIRCMIDQHFGTDPKSLRPLSGRRALDVGCGAGLVCEPLSRLGAAVTGVEAAEESVSVARDHATAMGLAVRYHLGGVETLDERNFDLITCLEVIEHVNDPAAFLRDVQVRLASGGLLILSTPNRTAASRIALVGLAERLGLIPAETHDWNRFITPDEMTGLLEDVGLRVLDIQGISFDPRTGFTISQRQDLNYIMAIVQG